MAVKNLFTSLIYGGFAAETVEINKNWEDCLAKEFHEFAGDHHRFRGLCSPFQFYSAPTSDTDRTPSVKLKLAPPLATQTVSRGEQKIFKLIPGVFFASLTCFFSFASHNTIQKNSMVND